MVRDREGQHPAIVQAAANAFLVYPFTAGDVEAAVRFAWHDSRGTERVTTVLLFAIHAFERPSGSHAGPDGTYRCRDRPGTSCPNLESLD